MARISHTLSCQGASLQISPMHDVVCLWTCHQNGSWRVKKNKKSQPSGGEKLPNEVRPQLRLSLPEAESMTSISVNEILARLSLSREQSPQETLGSRSDHTHRTSCQPRACSPMTRWQSRSPRSRRAGSLRRRAGPRCSPHRCRRRRHCRCRWCCHCLSSPCSGSSGCPAGSASPPSARPAGCYCDGMRLARVPRSRFWGLCKRRTSWLPAFARNVPCHPFLLPRSTPQPNQESVSYDSTRPHMTETQQLKTTLISIYHSGSADIDTMGEQRGHPESVTFSTYTVHQHLYLDSNLQQDWPILKYFLLHRSKNDPLALC